MTRRLLYLAVTIASSWALPAFAEKVEHREFRYRTSLKVTAFAEEAEVIINPLHRPQIKYVIPDGAFAEKGDILTEFDGEAVSNRLRDLRFEQKEVETQLLRDLTEITNKDKTLRDDLEGMKDRMAVLRAKLLRFNSLPDKDEVKIVGGRLRVAELECSAATNELAKAADRLKKKMISPAQFEEAELEYLDKKARLTNAEKHLELVSRPAPSLEIRKLTLQIENLKMEIEKTAHEIDETANIARIQKEGAAAKKQLIESKIREREDEQKQIRIYAPYSGHVMYLKRFRDEVLKSGRQMWKNFSYLKIPNRKTLAFKGQILETERKFFKVGDKASLQPTGGPMRPMEGSLVSISRLSHDRGEKEEESWGKQGGAESGVMVYDVIIKPDTPGEMLHIGMHATCELTSSETSAGPSIPLSRAKKRGNKTFLSIKGEYREVKGEPIQGYLVLEDESLLGQNIDMFGEFQEEKDALPADDGSLRLRALGELRPVDTTDVTVKRIWRWQKVSWLIKEDTEVKKGDAVARLEKKEINEELDKWESRMKEAVSSRQALEEESGIKTREMSFQLAREKNLLTIAEIDLTLTREYRNWPSIYDMELSLKRITLRLESLDRQLARLKGRNLVSPLELERLKRDRQRAVLEKEGKQIQLESLLAGSDLLAIRRAELAHFKQKLSVNTLEQTVETEKFRISRNITRSKRREMYMRRTLDERKEWKANHTLYAPCDGLVQYARIYNNGVFSKVSPGSVVGQRFVLMKIADLSRMFVRVEIPEKYYTLVKPKLPVEIHIPSITEKRLSGKVSEIEFLFENKRKKDVGAGLYSAHEPLGETVFFARIEMDPMKDVLLKPGAIAHVYFPFQK